MCPTAGVEIPPTTNLLSIGLILPSKACLGGGQYPTATPRETSLVGDFNSKTQIKDGILQLPVYYPEKQELPNNPIVRRETLLSLGSSSTLAQ
jgi:hypothetical protein